MGFLSNIIDSGTLQIGLDIGASAVKVVAVKVSANGIKLVGLGIEDTPIGCITDGVITDPKIIIDVIKSALIKADIKRFRGVSVNVGMRGVGIILRKLMLPMGSKEEMEEQIILEAQQQIEADLTDWIISHQIVSQADRQGQVAVILVGAKRSMALDYGNTLKMIGLRPAVFDCDIFAMANAVEHALGGIINETILCLDIGRDSTKFHLIQNDIPIIIRTFQSSGIHLTELISKKMAIDFDEAENLKKTSSSNENGSMPKECEKAFSEHIKELTLEIKQTIDFFANSNSDNAIDTIDRVILCGGGTATRGLQEAIAEMLKTKVEFINPFARTAISSQPQQLLQEYPPHVFAVAFGLAMRKTGDTSE